MTFECELSALTLSVFALNSHHQKPTSYIYAYKEKYRKHSSWSKLIKKVLVVCLALCFFLHSAGGKKSHKDLKIPQLFVFPCQKSLNRQGQEIT